VATCLGLSPSHASPRREGAARVGDARWWDATDLATRPGTVTAFGRPLLCQRRYTRRTVQLRLLLSRTARDVQLLRREPRAVGRRALAAERFALLKRASCGTWTADLRSTGNASGVSR
jgi:hypothetical protein